MEDLKQSFLQFIDTTEYPCIGARAAAKKNFLNIIIANDLEKSLNDIEILTSVYELIRNWTMNQEPLQTLAVIFEQPSSTINELQFERLLWYRLQGLHHLDRQIFPWSPSVSSNVSHPKFSFSLGGSAFFIVGMHPSSTRKSRKFIRPVLVFNLHEQFEKLRSENTFECMQQKIRENDSSFSGTINPMLADFGESSEALQYSGRMTSKDYICPFSREKEEEKGWVTIQPRSASGFILKKNNFLIVEDVLGEQVADLFSVALSNQNECLSSGKSFDYNDKILFSTGDCLYSNFSNPMLSIIKDDVGRHDFLLAPCNKDTFRIIYKEISPSSGCFEHLEQVLTPYSVPPQNITTTFNIFMNVALELPTGQFKVLPPISKKGDKIVFKSHMDLIIGLTACSAGQSNNFSYKPIRYKIVS